MQITFRPAIGEENYMPPHAILMPAGDGVSQAQITLVKYGYTDNFGKLFCDRWSQDGAALT